MFLDDWLVFYSLSNFQHNRLPPLQGRAAVCLAQRRPVQPEQVYPRLCCKLFPLCGNKRGQFWEGKHIGNNPSSAIVSICISATSPLIFTQRCCLENFMQHDVPGTQSVTFLGLSVYSQKALKPNLGMLTKYLLCFDSFCLTACWRFCRWWGW